ncbi:MAG: hypothetical protein ABFS14_11435 [Gemmatimonadota bacterium]
MQGKRSAKPARLGTLLCLFGAVSTTSASQISAQQDREAKSSDAAFRVLDEAGGLKASGAFPFDYQHLAFQSPGSDSIQVWAAASVHAGRVRGVFDGGWRYSLGLRFDVFQSDSLIASEQRRFEHVLNREVPHETADGFPLQVAVRVPPGDYTYRIEVVDYNWSEGRSTNRKTGDLTVPEFDDTRPLVSSIAIAADSGGAWNPAPGVALKLNAARIVRKRSRPYVYFEVYGLTPGGEYRGEVKLRSTWVSRGKGERFAGAYQPFQMQYRGTAPADPDTPVRTTLRLDMDRTEPGPFEITVRIVDLSTGLASSVRHARLRVQEIDRSRPVTTITEVAVPARPENAANAEETP